MGVVDILNTTETEQSLPAIRQMRWVYRHGLPYMVIQFCNGVEGFAGCDQKMLNGHGWPFANIEGCEEEFAVTIPADPRDGRPFATLAWGYTANPEIVELVRDMMRAVEREEFREQDIVVPPHLRG